MDKQEIQTLRNSYQGTCFETDEHVHRLDRYNLGLYGVVTCTIETHLKERSCFFFITLPSLEKKQIGRIAKL